MSTTENSMRQIKSARLKDNETVVIDREGRDEREFPVSRLPMSVKMTLADEHGIGAPA